MQGRLAKIVLYNKKGRPNIPVASLLRNVLSIGNQLDAVCLACMHYDESLLRPFFCAAHAKLASRSA